MNVVNLASLAHQKPLTLAVSATSANVEIDPNAKYILTSNVDLFFRIDDVNTAGSEADATDYFIPARVPTLIPKTGKKYFIALGSATGIAQLVHNG